MSAGDWEARTWELRGTGWRSYRDLGAFPIIKEMDSPSYEGKMYAVRLGGLCLSIHGQWDIEPMPSRRDKAFYEEFRFKTFEEAMDAAEAAIKKKITQLRHIGHIRESSIKDHITTLNDELMAPPFEGKGDVGDLNK